MKLNKIIVKADFLVWQDFITDLWHVEIINKDDHVLAHWRTVHSLAALVKLAVNDVLQSTTNTVFMNTTSFSQSNIPTTTS